MTSSITFIRLLFIILSTLFATIYTTSNFYSGISVTNVALGVTYGLAFSLFLILSEIFLRKVTVKSLFVSITGLFIGSLLGYALLSFVDNLIDLSSLNLTEETLGLTKIVLFLVTTYASMIACAIGAEEFYLSIPFFRFQSMNLKRKDLILDPSILLDPRILDLVASGIVDTHLVLPRFVVKELMDQAESTDENVRFKAKRALETIKKIENHTDLQLRIDETDFSEIKEIFAKLIKLARTLDANILAADLNRIQQSNVEGIKIINIHLLANALKPITQSGELIEIKIQRVGKDPLQGVGYLEDGTMVVVNGGADFLLETVKAKVLSVKHTSSGRLIFCNVAEQEDRLSYALDALDNPPRNYFVTESGY